MIRLMCFGILLFAVLQLSAQSPREKINFDSGWKFHFGNANDPSRDFNYSIAPIFSKNGKAETTAISKKFDDSNWRTLDLPHDWAVELPFVESNSFDVMAHGYKPVGGLFPETSIGWYRKQFVIAKEDSSKRFTIQFDGVFRNSEVWVNGFWLGRNESGYMGFTYDITDFVSFATPNVLVVRVDATQYEGWFYEGAGIYRHVWLNKFNSLHIDDDAFVFTEVANKSAKVNLQSTVVNRGLTKVEGRLSYAIHDRMGKLVVSTEETAFKLDAGAQLNLKEILQINNPMLWSLDNPYLYKLFISIKADGKVIDKRKLRFGVRTIEISPSKGLLVNQIPVKIKGVNCHQDHAGVGSALPDYLQYYRVRLLKEMGANAYRASHNPPTPQLLEACDSLGMLVMDETRLLNTSPEYTSQFKKLIVRDRNHPSIFMWSIGNEEGYIQTQSTGKRMALTMLQIQKELDPTRTSTYAADLGNVFNGINEVIPVRGFNYREKFVGAYHNDHPNQPIVGTEMGSTLTTRGIYQIDSVKAYLPDQDIHAPWWASTAEAWWPAAATNDWYMGGFIWTGFDYRGEPTPFKWPNINSHFGVMDVCGFPKNLYYYYQSWWLDRDVLHISPHWNWAGKEGEVMDVWVNSNADEVELFLNGKTLGKKMMQRNSHLKWQVKYQRGMLEARGKRNGKLITARVETTDAAYRLIINSDRKTIQANGRDATVVNVTVVDKKGRTVPDAHNLISFVLNGKGTIIGMGNGDPSSHESDKSVDGKAQRSLFNGSCQVIIQSTNEAGVIELVAVSEGLEKASVTIHSELNSSLDLSSR